MKILGVNLTWETIICYPGLWNLGNLSPLHISDLSLHFPWSLNMKTSVYASPTAATCLVSQIKVGKWLQNQDGSNAADTNFA